MIRKINKLFLLVWLFFICFFFYSCSNQGKDDVSSFMYIDYFYKKNANILKDNKVIIGIGNNVFDENNVKILPIDDDYYQGISITISIYVDDEIEPKNKIEISNNDFLVISI